MKNPALLKSIMLTQHPKSPSFVLPFLKKGKNQTSNQLGIKQVLARGNAGFTIIEVLVVVAIVGILVAIAAPSWLSFVNQQRINKINEATLNAIRQAQRESKRTKIGHSVRFRQEANSPPEVTIYPEGFVDPDDPGTYPALNDKPSYYFVEWTSLTEDYLSNPDQIWIGTNINNTNQAGDAIPLTDATQATIQFDTLGNLSEEPNDPDLGNLGLAVMVGVPGDNGGTIPSTKRCVKVRTLLGSTETARGGLCPG